MASFLKYVEETTPARNHARNARIKKKSAAMMLLEGKGGRKRGEGVRET
jgi:hypothetical protein